MSDKNTDYARVEGGLVVTSPGALPQIYQGMENFPNLPNHTLATFGWYPVWYACPKCTEGLAYEFDEEAQLIRVTIGRDALLGARATAIAHIDAQIEEALVQDFEGENFSNDATTFFYMTSVTHLVSWSLATTNPAGGVIPCMNLDGVEQLIHHTQEQAVLLSTAYGTHRQAILQNRLDRIQAVQESIDITAIQAIVDQGVDV